MSGGPHLNEYLVGHDAFQSVAFLAPAFPPLERGMI